VFLHITYSLLLVDDCRLSAVVSCVNHSWFGWLFIL